MACHYFEPAWDLMDNESFEDCWQRAPLERAHIVARSQGGTDEVENFVLLCRECHAAAPMVTDRAFMLRWCSGRAKRDPITTGLAEMREAAKAFGLTGREFHGHSDEDINAAMNRAVADVGMGEHFGVGISMATRVAIVARAAKLLKQS